MKNKFCPLLILLIIIIISFPSICFSELKTVEGEYCNVYLGDMKNKKELGEFRQTVRWISIASGIRKIDKTYNNIDVKECFADIINKYLEKVVVISHTEKGRKICDKVNITLNTEVIGKYLEQNACNTRSGLYLLKHDRWWYDDIDNVLTKITGKINIGLLIETNIPDLDGYKREQLENEEENQFYSMIKETKDKYKLIDRRHLSKILEEQKLSSSGITESDTVKLGKILNLDIIVLRLIYENSKVTKVLKVDTGEILLFKTYETY